MARDPAMIARIGPRLHFDGLPQTVKVDVPVADYTLAWISTQAHLSGRIGYHY
jgi:hypothetical protein